MNSHLPVERPVAGSSRLRFDLPVDGEPLATALFADDGIPEASRTALVRELTRRRVGVLHLEPGSTEDDIHAAVTVLSRSYPRPFLAVGHGVQGRTLVRCASSITTIRAVAAIAVPAEPEVTARLGSLRRALLVLHAPTDTEVGIEHAGRLVEAARHPKSFVGLDGADHRLSNERDARYAGSMIASWAARFQPGTDGARDHPSEPDASHGHWAAARIGRDRYHTEVLAGGHPILADEPARLNGSNHGPTPYELVLAGLAGCTAITIRMVADRKGWPLEGVRVKLRHDKVEPGDAGCEPTGPGKVDLFRIEVDLEGDLDETQHARLMEIAEKCPVHKTLKAGACLRTSVMAVEESGPAERGNT